MILWDIIWDCNVYINDTCIHGCTHASTPTNTHLNSVQRSCTHLFVCWLSTCHFPIKVGHHSYGLVQEALHVLLSAVNIDIYMHLPTPTTLHPPSRRGTTSYWGTLHHSAQPATMIYAHAALSSVSAHCFC